MQLLLFAAIMAGATMTNAQEVTYSDDDWAAVLDRYVDENGLVDYRGLAAAREPLDRYVGLVARVSPRSHPALFPSRNHELAYYLNVYNALVFHGVLEKGPDIPSVWGRTGVGYGFFAGTKHVVGGTKISLKKLEDAWIRKEFEDPRIHAALNCGSIGCPRLPRTPFRGAELDEQLDAAMSEFVRDERHCRVDEGRRTVTMSKIFDWFKKDFLAYERAAGSSSPSLIGYVNRYRGENRIPPDFDLGFARYDKGLNRQP